MCRQQYLICLPESWQQQQCIRCYILHRHGWTCYLQCTSMSDWQPMWQYGCVHVGPVALSTTCQWQYGCVRVGPVALSTTCQLISPGACVAGTVSITKSELYFEMDEDDPRNKKIDAKVCDNHWCSVDIQGPPIKSIPLQSLADNSSTV